MTGHLFDMAAESTTVACAVCGLLQRMEEIRPGTAAVCFRCGATLRERKEDSLARTAAFSLAALIFYVPANVYPILRMEFYGAYSESTVWDGIVSLFQADQWVVGVIVFLASILIPLFKLLGLFYLSATTHFGSARRRRERTWISRIIDVIGPWAMLDVFLLSILVALVKLEQLATVLPGPGILAFTAVVVFTILASASFDPRVIWEEAEKGK
ncbi:MAG: paraquat-inducible protein A [Deltaproteobacteria bacterium]|nr:paraquat-inducible protein A [Deltaproteobacteria bacterium]PWB65764.1 MAG: paraquat-inducible protein A [Deltaproteobacteria bacterium]